MSSDASWKQAWIESWRAVYPHLVNFPDLLHCLLGYFPEADIEGLTDEEAAKKCVAEMDPKTRLSTIEQCKTLLLAPDFPWEEVSRASNRYFEDKDATLQWLKRMLNAAEREL